MTTTTTMLIPLDTVRVEQLHARVAAHGRGPDDRCAAPGCRDRWKCWHLRDAEAQLASFAAGGGR